MNIHTAVGTLLTVLIVPSLTAQASKPSSKPAAGAAQAAPAFTGPKLDAKVYTHFGEGTHEGKALTVADVLKDPKAFDGKQIRVTGDIGSVCQKKGCWMKVGEGQNEIMVRFKDYAFFVPKDASGQTVFEGVFKVTEQSVDEVKHYLEDAGKPEEAAKVTAPKKVFGFMAEGVSIKKADAAKTETTNADPVRPPKDQKSPPPAEKK